MHCYWLNGNVVLAPESDEERAALLVLSQNVKRGSPFTSHPDSSQNQTSGLLEQVKNDLIASEKLRPGGPIVKLGDQ